MLKLRLIRHPKPQVAAGICYGATDLHAEPDALQDQIESCLLMPVPRLVLSSPLQRCAALAHGLAARGWPAPRLDADLAEMNFGEWEMKPWHQIARHQIDAWARDISAYRPPGGESVQGVAQRALAAIERALLEDGHELERGLRLGAEIEPLDMPPSIMVICHSGVIQGLSHILSARPWVEFKPLNLAYGEIRDVLVPRVRP
jgi:alpha-ribazole phosphatase